MTKTEFELLAMYQAFEHFYNAPWYKRVWIALTIRGKAPDVISQVVKNDFKGFAK